MGPTESKDTEKYDQNKFLVLGCHFGRSEKPFTYEIAENKYTMYSSSEQFIDMYRSNDVVQLSRSSIYIRPFVKVGETAQNVRVHQYFLDDVVE